MDRVISSRNLFIDTDRGTNQRNTKGDDYECDLNTENISAGPGEQIRIIVNEFAMYKSWTNVNDNNNLISLRYVGTGTYASANTTITLQPQNYEVLFDIATELASKMSADIVANITGVTTCVASAVLPPTTAGINGTSDNRISFTLTTDVAHGLTTFDVQCFESQGDSYEIIGGNRLLDTETTSSSVQVTFPSATTIAVQGYYPAQRSTTSYIYLRTNVPTNNIESSSLHNATGQDHTTAVQASNILCRIPVNSEFCIYNANHGGEYFVDLSIKHLNHLRLFVTDEHNRPIARRTLTSLTASRVGLGYAAGGVADRQSTRGNLNFSAVIRVEVIQRMKPAEQVFAKAETDVEARKLGLKLYPNRPPL